MRRNNNSEYNWVLEVVIVNNIRYIVKEESYLKRGMVWFSFVYGD